MFNKFENYPPRNEDIVLSAETKDALQAAVARDDVLGWRRIQQMGYDAASLLLNHLEDGSIHNVLDVADSLLLAEEIPVSYVSTFREGMHNAIIVRQDMKRGAVVI